MRYLCYLVVTQGLCTQYTWRLICDVTPGLSMEYPCSDVSERRVRRWLWRERVRRSLRRCRRRSTTYRVMITTFRQTLRGQSTTTPVLEPWL